MEKESNTGRCILESPRRFVRKRDNLRGERELRDLEEQQVCLWRIWYQNEGNIGAVSGVDAMLQST